MKIIYYFKLALCLVLLLGSQSSYAQQFATMRLDTLMVPVSKGISTWADFNRDGWLDLLIAGQDAEGVYSTQVYFSDSLASLRKAPYDLPALMPGSNAGIQLAAVDFDHDNHIDIIMMGKFTEGWALKLFRNNAGSSFQEVSQPVVVEEGAAFITGDFRNNGTVQLLLTGPHDNNATRVLAYTGNAFEELTATGLPVVTGAKLLAFDFNKDSRLDVFVMGTESDTINGPLTEIFLNDGELSFTPMKAGFEPLSHGDASLLDFNADGWYDVVLTGKNAEGATQTALYIHKEDRFEPLEARLSTDTPLLPGKILTGDFDNDGFMDVLIAGTDTTEHKPLNRIYYGFHGQAVQKDSTILSLSDQSLSLVDFNEDGSLDIFIAGKDSTGAPAGFLLHNKVEEKNWPPGFPRGKFAAIEGDTVILFWDPAFDDHTHSNSLTYTIKILFGTEQIVTPSTNDINNRRTVVALGAQSTETFYKIWGLPRGSYRWDVYAVDNSYKGSEYFGGSGGGGGLFPCPLVFDIFAVDTIRICENEEVSITFNPADVEGAVERIEWRTSSGRSLGVGNSIAYRPRSSETVAAKIIRQGEGDCYSVKNYAIDVIKKPVIDLESSYTECEGEEVTLELNLEEVTYAWNSEKRGNLGTSNKITYKVTENDKIKVVVKPKKEECASEAVININMVPLAVVSAGQPRVTCPQEPVTLGPGNEINATDFIFEWTPSAALNNASLKNPVASPAQTTWYYIAATHRVTGCISKDSVLVTVRDKRVIDAGVDKDICLGESVQLGGAPTASGPDPVYTYSWTPATGLNNTTSANPIASPLATTRYRLVVSSENCRPDTAYVTVNVHAPPPSGVYHYAIEAGESVTLNGSGGVAYNWSPATGLSATNVASPVASPLVTTTYKVEVTDAYGCTSVSEHIVTVTYNLFIPNLFSPNGDGSNDTFRVYGNAIKNITFQVFFRHGQLLWETTSVGTARDTGWDGTFNGKEQPNGTYIWTLSGEFMDGSPLLYEGKNTGKFTLIR